jgi:hypothetical protein
LAHAGRALRDLPPIRRFFGVCHCIAHSNASKDKTTKIIEFEKSAWVWPKDYRLEALRVRAAEDGNGWRAYRAWHSRHSPINSGDSVVLDHQYSIAISA